MRLEGDGDDILAASYSSPKPLRDCSEIYVGDEWEEVFTVLSTPTHCKFTSQAGAKGR